MSRALVFAISMTLLVTGQRAFGKDPSTAPSGQPAQQFKSAKANDAIRKYEEAKKKLADAYAKKQVEYRETLISLLEDAQKETTHAGDLDDALAIRNKIKELRDGGETKVADEPDAQQDSAKVQPSVAHKLVIWNMHNGTFGDRGTDTLNIILLHGTEEVWRVTDAKLPWSNKPQDPFFIWKPPTADYDTIRIEISKIRDKGGGLSEVAIVGRGTANLLRSRKLTGKLNITASSSFDAKTNELNVIDGITTSYQNASGYWSMKDGETGWLQIQLPDTVANLLEKPHGK